MMKKAYLHIGLEKTGTTSIQRFLTVNRSPLQAAGLSYLGDDAKPYFAGIGHFPIAGCFHSERPRFISPEKFRSRSEVLGALKDDVQQCPDDVILSCEHFSSRLHDPGMLEAIRGALADRQVTIICYLRRQDSMALAAYATRVLYGHEEPFSVEDVIESSSPYFDYLSIGTLWSSVFGADSMIIREFDRKRFPDGDVRRDFLDLLGIDSHGFHFGGDENISLDAAQVESLRVINQRLNSIAEKQENPFDFAQEARWSIVEHLPRGKPLHTILEAGERERIVGHFKASNEQLAKIFDSADFLRRWHHRNISAVTAAQEPSTVDHGFPEIIAKLSGQLVTERHTASAFQEKYRRVEQQLASVGGELAEVKQSSSWKLTAALRAIGPWVRRVLGLFPARFTKKKHY